MIGIDSGIEGNNNFTPRNLLDDLIEEATKVIEEPVVEKISRPATPAQPKPKKAATKPAWATTEK